MKVWGKVGLGLGIGLPLLLIVSPIALAYGFLYDTSESKFVHDESFDATYVTGNMMADALENTPTTKKISIGLSEKEINESIFAAINSSQASVVNEYITPYIQVDSLNSLVDFHLDVNTKIFSTRVRISTTIDYIDGENQEAGFKFGINAIEIGRLKSGFIALNIVNHFISDEDIQNAMANAGLNMRISLKDRTMFYPKAAFIEDLKKNNANAQGQDFTSLLAFMLDNQLLDLSIDKEMIGINLNLEKMITNTNYSYNANPLDTKNKMDEYLIKCESLLKNEIIKMENADLMMNYLAYGYDKAPAEIKSFINPLDLTTIGITDKTSYKGLNITTSVNLQNDFQEQILSQAANIVSSRKVNIDFSETQFNEFLRSSKIIGKSLNFTSFDGIDYNINNIYVEDMYANICNNELAFIAEVSVNGLSTDVVIPCILGEMSNQTINFNIKNMMYGNLVMPEAMQDTWKSIVFDAISGFTTLVEGNPATNTISLNLGSMVNNLTVDPSVKNILLNSEATCGINATSLQEDGKLNITFTEK